MPSEIGNCSQQKGRSMPRDSDTVMLKQNTTAHFAAFEHQQLSPVQEDSRRDQCSPGSRSSKGIRYVEPPAESR